MSLRKSFLAAVAAASFALAATPEWVKRSNEHAQILLQLQAKYAPEGAAATGVEGIDDQISDLSDAANERQKADLRAVGEQLKKLREAEKDPLVRQDLDIMVTAVERSIRAGDLNEKLGVPYTSVAQLVFQGVRALLDDQIAEKRRPAALVRLRKYSGVAEGFSPVAQVAMARIQARLTQPGRLMPFKARVEQDLAQSGFFLDGIGAMFAKYKIEGYQEPLAKLREQVKAYDAFVRSDVLPKARTDFRLPAELYAVSLENFGVDLPPADLTKKAHAAFREIQAQMKPIAARVAVERGLKGADYRTVIAELKKEQLDGNQILPHYRGRIEQIEAIIRNNDLFTVPDRPSRMRLATPAESAASPAPNMRPPRLVGNTGESGEFLLPTRIPDPTGKTQSFDDFTFAAASWTLTAHEARPGHEMQFAAMVEKGVSTARVIYSFNSTNVEGWGLYTEWVMQPFLPLEGQLIALQHRLLRAARAYLDPELQMGKVTVAEATRVLREDVVLSEAMARQETDRYTFRSPGQATSYFYGYTRLLELRQEVEKKLGPKFNARKFHDAVLEQGLLPPDLMRTAVLNALGI